MSDIVSLDSHRDNVKGHLICLQCKHEDPEYQYVLRADDDLDKRWFECPKCNCIKATWKGTFFRHGFVWFCQCGSDLFRLSEKGPYCVICGTYATGWDE
jgi:hypothetical protein